MDKKLWSIQTTAPWSALKEMRYQAMQKKKMAETEMHFTE
jgi:hypothetical protein